MMKVDKSDWAELGREEDADSVERESLSNRRSKPDRFNRSGGDCKGDTVSKASSEPLSSLCEGPVKGENSGSGTATDDSVAFVDRLSEEGTLLAVCLSLGMLALPESSKPSWDNDRTLKLYEGEPIERGSDSECIVESCELQ